MFKKWRERLKDPKARLRLMLYLGWVVIALLFITPLSLAISSNPKFCALCHENRPAIEAWKRSVHSDITCYGCHAEYGAINLFKEKLMVGLPSGWMKVTGDYPIPINGGSKLSEEMAEHVEATCLHNCHAPKNRKFTVSNSLNTEAMIKRSHKKHEENKIGCPACHNRVAHPDPRGYIGEEKAKREMEKAQAGLPWDARVGAPKEVYADHLKMRYCMKCHTGEEGKKKGSKDCSLCHPKNFPLKPKKSHSAEAFLKPVVTGQRAIHSRMAKLDEEYCNACHEKKFCDNCHKMEMPHPTKPVNNWTAGKKEHAQIGQSNPGSCVMCHPGPTFCTDCHHYDQLAENYKRANLTYTPGISFRNQHPGVVQGIGAKPCFTCHDPRFCAHCHVTGELRLE